MYEYEIFLKSKSNDLFFKFDGWYPIQTELIPKGKIDYFLEKEALKEDYLKWIY